jgi:hypothetical protein
MGVISLERGSSKRGPQMDEAIKEESEALERSGREPTVEDFKEKELDSEEELSDTGSSADVYPHQDLGETGGKGHPMPKDESERTSRKERKLDP